MKAFVAVVASLLVSRVAVAQTYCVRHGATGSGDGSDWTNALPDLPDSLVRGATYYLAAGSYAGHEFNDPESGTSVISVKKAVAGDHGPDVGWEPSYGDKEALFTGELFFDTGYYTVDGQTGGGPGSWAGGLGIRVYNASAPERMRVNGSGGSWHDPPFPGHFTFRHIDFQGMGYHLPYANSGSALTFISYDTTPGTGPAHVTFQYCYFHDTAEGVAPIQGQAADHFLIEHSEFARTYYTAANHTEAASVWHSNDWTIRYNRFVDVQGTATLTFFGADGSGDYNNNMYVYGNVCYGTGSESSGMGFVVLDPQNSISPVSHGIYVFNNTIVNSTGGISFGVELLGDPSSTNNQVYNNLWVNSAVDVQIPGGSPGGIGGSGDGEDYNTLVNPSYRPNWFTGANDDNYASGDPFVDEAADDFRLAAHTDPGIDQSSVFKVDMLGHPFNPAQWDRGAFAYYDASRVSAGGTTGNTSKDDLATGCACSAQRSNGGPGTLSLLLALVGWCANRRRWYRLRARSCLTRP